MAKPITIVERVKLFFFLWNTFVAVGLFSFLIKYKLNIKEYFPTWTDFLNIPNILNFIDNKWGVAILSASYVVMYIAVSFEANTLRKINENLFSRDNMPIEWRYVKGRALLTLNVAFAIAIFLGLAWFVDNIAAFCGVLACLH